jgi:exodeoxyribonuclease VIII
MQLGTVMHAMMLEHDTLSEIVIIVPEGIDRRTKDGKVWYAEADQSGKILIKSQDLLEINDAVESINKNADTKMLRQYPWIIEQPMVWGKFKAKPDAIIEPCDDYPSGLIFDLKSSVSAKPSDFANQAYKLGYHIQAAHYCDGFMQTYGTDAPPVFMFLAAEKTAPYLCQWFKCSDRMLEVGITERDELTEKIEQAATAGIWGGYSDKIETLDLPRWVKHESHDDDNEINELF